MEPGFKRAIARVQVGGERGTAFLVAEDVVLTALHVVARVDGARFEFYPDPIRLFFFDGPQKVAAAPIPGLVDPVGDWVALRCERSLEVEPLGLDTTVEVGDAWSAFGYAMPRADDGMVFAGEVADADARFRRVEALQLFAAQAAAGSGAPVAGLSGAPVVVEGRVVGLVRANLKDALGDDRRNLAGTIYACPVDTIAALAGDRLPCPDARAPTLGELPEVPYPGLRWFRTDEAPVFFGRSRES